MIEADLDVKTHHMMFWSARRCVFVPRAGHVKLISQRGELLNETRQPPFDLVTGNYFDLGRIHLVWLLPSKLYTFISLASAAPAFCFPVSVSFSRVSREQRGGNQAALLGLLWSSYASFTKERIQRRACGRSWLPFMSTNLWMLQRVTITWDWWKRRPFGDKGPRVPLRCALPPRKNELQNIAFSNARQR